MKSSRCTIVRRLTSSALSMLMLACPTAQSSAQKAIFLVRHAEQTPVGGMMDGDPPLNQAGRQRAAALSAHLRQAGITAIYTSQYARSRETAEPIADALGIRIEHVAKDDLETLSKHLREKHARDIVLLIAHSDTIPQVLKSWGDRQQVEVGKTEFASLWLIVPQPNAEPFVSKLQLQP